MKRTRLQNIKTEKDLLREFSSFDKTELSMEDRIANYYRTCGSPTPSWLVAQVFGVSVRTVARARAKLKAGTMPHELAVLRELVYTQAAQIENLRDRLDAQVGELSLLRTKLAIALEQFSPTEPARPTASRT